MTTLELKNQLFGTSHNYKSSLYIDYNGLTVRVSDHLPKIYNLKDYNNEGDKIFFVFTDCDFSHSQAEKYLDETIGYYFDYDFLVFEDGDDIEMIKRYIDRNI